MIAIRPGGRSHVDFATVVGEILGHECHRVSLKCVAQHDKHRGGYPVAAIFVFLKLRAANPHRRAEGDLALASCDAKGLKLRAKLFVDLVQRIGRR